MQPHGSYTLTRKDQAVIVKAFGAWNFETAENCGKEFIKLVCELRHKPWGCLLDLTEWDLFTPDASACLHELNKWSGNNNQKYEVVVCDSPTQHALIEKDHDVLLNVETKFCENIEQAYLWLESVGVIKT